MTVTYHCVCGYSTEHYLAMRIHRRVKCPDSILKPALRKHYRSLPIIYRGKLIYTHQCRQCGVRFFGLVAVGYHDQVWRCDKIYMPQVLAPWQRRIHKRKPDPTPAETFKKRYRLTGEYGGL